MNTVFREVILSIVIYMSTLHLLEYKYQRLSIGFTF